MVEYLFRISPGCDKEAQFFLIILYKVLNIDDAAVELRGVVTGGALFRGLQEI